MFIRSTRHRRTTTSAATIIGLTAAALAVAVGPAQAETQRFSDAAGDMTSGQQVHPGDIRNVAVTHEDRLRVRIVHHNLKSHAQIVGKVFIDTNIDRPGPELVLTGGLSEGTDYYLTRARNWKAVGEHLTCSHSLGLSYSKDRSTFTIGRGCLGDTEKVRVAVRVSGPSSESVDWLEGKRTFTRYVAR